MTQPPWREAYRFHERDWNNYEALRDWFEWKIPDDLNIATEVCGRWAVEDPGRSAIVARSASGRAETWSFGDLDADRKRLAGYLRSQGASRGDRVAVCCSPSPEAAVALLACWTLGAVTVPLSTLFGPEAIGHRVRDAAISHAVADDPAPFLRHEIGDSPLEHIVVTGNNSAPTTGEDGPLDLTTYETAIEGGTPVESVSTHATDDALILYTSGTTGGPKPARHAHRFLLNNLPGFLTATCNLELRENDVIWTPAEWAWFATLFCVLLPGLYYGKRVLAYDGGKFDPAVALDLLDRHDVTQFVAPPAALRKLREASHGTADLGSLRTITCGAHDSDIAAWVEDRLQDTVIHENYGQTEAGILVGECSVLRDTGPGIMGMAVPGYELHLLDHGSHEPLADPGEVGELAVTVGDQPICFKGYLNRPTLTRETLVDGRLLTGDLASRASESTFEFEGRRGNLIISAGHSIGPEEVESCLRDHPAVAEVGVVGVRDEERGEVPKAFVELAPGNEGDDQLVGSIKDHVRDRLAKYKYPRQVEFLPDIPMERGKVQRSELRALARK